MEWRGVTIYNAFIANFFFAAAFGLVVTAQWELSIGNGFSYTVFSSFGMLIQRPEDQCSYVQVYSMPDMALS